MTSVTRGLPDTEFPVRRRVHPVRRMIRTLILTLVVVLILVATLIVLIVFRHPTEAVVYSVNHFAPEVEFSAESVAWISSDSIEVRDAQFGNVLKVPEIKLSWHWDRLLDRRLDELKLRGAKLTLDFAKIGVDAAFSARASSPATWIGTWYLDRLSMEQGGLVILGLGNGVPPLSVELEGEYENIPLGGDLSESDLTRLHPFRLRDLTIYSPLDPAVTLLKIDEILVQFRYGSLKEKLLHSITFYHPTLNVDRGFFWFVEELRKLQKNHPSPTVAQGAPWRVRYFEVQKGRLDISRLHEVSLEYPFDFEVKRENLNLSDLSLAQFNVQLNIPNQNLYISALQISLKNLHGKISFNMSQEGTIPETPLGQAPKANDLVNTLYAEKIEWNDLEVTAPWLSMTFDPNGITTAYGGEFATGYINGGATCGWSNHEAWRTWGAAADIDAETITHALGKQNFIMDGRAALSFDLLGKEAGLYGNLKLRSLTTGTMRFLSMGELQEKIAKTTTGVRKELLEWFVKSLKEYPFKQYALNVEYQKPHARLDFRSESPLGARRIELNWNELSPE